MARIFGFDIGTTSIGFVVIDHDPVTETGDILRMGARIFPEARDPDGTPMNQTRRLKRMMRRQLRRRRTRRRSLNERLASVGLLPPFGSDDWHILMNSAPLELRVRGLSLALSPYELGRALYHLAQRRHFKGRDLEEADENEEVPSDEREAASNRELTAGELKATGQTLGQFLLGKSAHGRVRGTHAVRSDVMDEFNRLWDVQAEYHACLRDPGFRATIEEVVFAQRPVFWRKNTLGECRFIPGETLCPKGSWLSQQRRMLEKLNNLSIVGGNLRPLDMEERTAVLKKLESQASMSWSAVRTALKPLYKAREESGREKNLRFNLEEGGETKLLGNAVEANLANIFGDSWPNHPHKQALRDAVHQRLWMADYDEIGEQRVVIRSEMERAQYRADAERSFIADYGVTAEQAAELRGLHLPTGWEPFSTRALHLILPHLDAGIRFGTIVNGPDWQEWRTRNFPDMERPTGEICDRLPSPASKDEQRRLAALRNPTVVRTQNELRKVVNNLIAVYGKPDLIRIELAREVGKSKREREEMKAGLKKQEKRRRDALNDLRSKGLEPSRLDIEKWLLWKESQERCPYTGDQIGFDALFRNGDFEIEHIWPRSRSFDDSYGNKTLCRRDVNIAKANKTPFEYFEHRTDEWAAIIHRLQSLVAGKGGVGMSPGKVKRFLAPSLPEDFAARQLTDTAFASRQAITFLKRLWPDVGIESPVTVQAVTGRVTAQLRKLWELNNTLSDAGEKTRTDHRHHAVDALVVACTHPGMTQKLSAYWQAKDDPTAVRPRLERPWPTIRQDVTQAVAGIIVSHRVSKKISGPLHQEMPLGYTHQDTNKKGTTLGIYVKRMPVEKLSLETLKISRVEEISRVASFVVRDDGIRMALLAHLEAAGVKPDKAYPPYPRVGRDGPEIRKVRVLSVQQKNLMVPVANGFADPANNHHIAIYRLPDGKGDFDVVSLFEASRRLAKREPVVRRDRGDGIVFVMSLSPGDALDFPEGDKKGIWIVQGVWASGQIVLERMYDAGHLTTTYPASSSILKQNARKLSIDPIGRVRPAHD
jgi:CRISPR-associated endonuclease Csn1